VTARLLVAAVGMTAVVLAALVVPLGIANARSERRDLQAKVERDAQALASIVEDGLERSDPAVIASGARVARAYEARTGGRVVVVRRNGIAVVDSEGGVGRSFGSRPEIAAASALSEIPPSTSQKRRTRRSTSDVGYVTRTAPCTRPLDATGTAT